MRIIKLKGKTEDAIMKQIERDYDKRAIILGTQKEEATGHFKWFKSPHYVVTIAIKEEDDELSSMQMMQNTAQLTMPIVETKENATTDQASYEVLMDLKKQLGQLHDEIGELKKQPQSQTQVIEQVATNIKVEENKLLTCINHKLLNLGIKPEVCDKLLAQVNGEDSETIIRQLYDTLENQLVISEEISEAMPKILFFIGSTGVGKTTTIAKITAKYVLEEQKKVVLFTSDTYRIAAVEQLKTYADILGVPVEVIYDESELPSYIEKWKDVDHILIDTAGRSHKNEEQVKELRGLMAKVPEKEVFLVLNANTMARDVKRIITTYEQAESDFKLIVTKLDETDEIGNLVNIHYYANKPIQYITNGQNVPADIEAFNKETYITQLLGRLNDE